jgi:L-malate glycosyltransferase
MSHQKKKILHVIKSLGRGGAEMLLVETLKLHQKDTFEFHFIYFLPWKDQLVDSLRSAGGKVSCFSSGNNVRIILKARAVAKYVRENEIDVIHAHLPWAGFVARIAGRLTGKPVLYTEHNKQERYHRLTFFLNKFTFNWQHTAIAVSDDVAASIHKNIKPAINVITVLNGVNTEDFQRDIAAGLSKRKMLNIPDGAVIIGTIAVFRFQKRLEEWMEVIKSLTVKFPLVYGLIVGDGPLAGKLFKKQSALGLENRIIMAGLQTDVKPWLSAIDIYMMTSVFEGLPIALLEAMSMQCAIVSTDAGGISQVVQNGKDGLLASVEEWQNLTGLCERLITDHTSREQFASNARLRVQKEFSLLRMVSNLEKIYAGF